MIRLSLLLLLSACGQVDSPTELASNTSTCLDGLSAEGRRLDFDGWFFENAVNACGDRAVLDLLVDGETNVLVLMNPFTDEWSRVDTNDNSDGTSASFYGLHISESGETVMYLRNAELRLLHWGETEAQTVAEDTTLYALTDELAVWFDDETLVIYDVQTGAVQHSISANSSTMGRLSLSDDQQLLSWMDNDAGLHVFDRVSGQERVLSDVLFEGPLKWTPGAHTVTYR